MARNRAAHGFSLLEVMTVVAVLGVLAAFAFPSTKRMLARQDAKASATQVAGLLDGARGRALAEGTPHLVYFDTPTVGADGECSALAREVRDADHSYSVTPGDATREIELPDKVCEKVRPLGEDPSAPAELAAVPLPAEDFAARAPDAAARKAANAANGNGNGKSQGKGSAAKELRTATVAETVVDGATFPVDANGEPVVAFSERGIPVDPADPTSWGSGAGGVYFTDGESTVVGALVGPLGEVQLRVYDLGTATWR